MDALAARRTRGVVASSLVRLDWKWIKDFSPTKSGGCQRNAFLFVTRALAQLILKGEVGSFRRAFADALEVMPGRRISGGFRSKSVKVHGLSDTGMSSRPTIDALCTKDRTQSCYVSLFLVLVGSRAAVINYGGNSVPFGDEWDGCRGRTVAGHICKEISRLAVSCFSAHNEHVIFFTRLMTLLIFKISGYWDVILQMIANAILDAADGRGDQRGAFANAPGRVGAECDDSIRSHQRHSLGLGKHSAWVQHALLSVAGVLICWSLASGGQPRVVAAMVRRRPLLGRFISLHGVGRPDPWRGDGSASCADRVQSQGRAAGNGLELPRSAQ